MNEEKSARYHRVRRRTRILSVAVVAAALSVILVSGFSVRLRAVTSAAAVRLLPVLVTPIALAMYVVALVAALELLTLPVAYYALRLERRYGLSTQGTAKWLRDRAKGAALGMAIAVGAAEVVVLTMRLTPGAWWAISAAIFAIALVGIGILAPAVLLPIFYRFTPLERDTLRQRLLVLAARAGAGAPAMYEWRLGDRTSRANAALVGIGRTRRILLSDTLLAAYSDDEIEVILAHELAHHVQADIWKGLVFEAFVACAGLLLAHLTLGGAWGPLGLASAADPAGLPAIALAAGLVSGALRPLAHALSRRHERRADRFALDLTRNPSAFVSAMRRLGAQNLSEDYPSRIVEALFHSHPPLPKRIAAAQQWQAPIAERGLRASTGSARPEPVEGRTAD